MNNFKIVKGLHVALTEGEEAEFELRQQEVYSVEVLRRGLMEEAEERIAKGVIFNGNAFRCDPASVFRVQTLESLARVTEEAGDVFSATFKTSEGISITLSSHAEVFLLLRAVGQHLTDILSKSAARQDDVAVMTIEQRSTFKVKADEHWAS
jgi:hypothetical protein